MTALPSLSRDVTEDVLKRWQASASARWKHIDPPLLAPNGAIWQAMQSVLRVLNAAQVNLSPPLSQEAVAVSSASPYPLPPADLQPGKAVPPDTMLDALRDALHSCAATLADLPVAWADLRQLLHLLAAELRGALEQMPASSPLSAQNTKGQNPELQETADASASGLDINLYEAGLEALAGEVADIRVAQLEQQVAQHQEQTFATQHLAERFLGNASHELRTPLTAILGFAELLLEGTYGDLNPGQITTVGHIENSAQNLNEIVSNMLDLLHIRAGKLNLQYKPVDVTAMLEHLYGILMPLAGRKNVQFHMELPPDLGAVELDENIVRHIVYHLLSSALRATPSGGDVLLIARRQPPSLILEAHDTALHLPPDAVANMLDPFPRLENSPTRGYEGWEVGLPLVRRYVDLHRGELRLESLPEKGTVFYVTLPLNRPREASPDTAIHLNTR